MVKEELLQWLCENQLPITRRLTFEINLTSDLRLIIEICPENLGINSLRMMNLPEFNY